jgi:hypothetical protein
LAVGQIYLLANPLLREPLRIEHLKPRLLGHWGTTPGLNLIYAHLNRVIRNWDLNMIYVTGPGHGGPGAHHDPLAVRAERTPLRRFAGTGRLAAGWRLGLVTFGVYCCCEARWRKVRPG